MEPTLTLTDELDSEPDEELLVHSWRTEQLGRLGLSRILAETFADLVDWHALAELVERGCSPELALERSAERVRARSPRRARLARFA